ncbi:MAG: hypothetical protein JRI31_12160, partial [Deltaproteobacteria bacterium]|nr:hypothetical protein [Deltaproteobacteria bacterium]
VDFFILLLGNCDVNNRSSAHGVKSPSKDQQMKNYMWSMHRGREKTKLAEQAPKPANEKSTCFHLEDLLHFDHMSKCLDYMPVEIEIWRPVI